MVLGTINAKGFGLCLKEGHLVGPFEQRAQVCIFTKSFQLLGEA